jgi:hypothetical protein
MIKASISMFYQITQLGLGFLLNLIGRFKLGRKNRDIAAKNNST